MIYLYTIDNRLLDFIVIFWKFKAFEDSDDWK